MIYLIIIISLLTLIYCISILYVIFGFVKLHKASKIKKAKIETIQKISVLIPVRNEQENIINCLKSLQNQDVNFVDFEVILINDHSTDYTLNIIKEFIEVSEMDISFYNLLDKTSKKEALKYGLTKSKYAVIATTDADCIVPESWLSIIAANVNDNANMLLGPVIFNKDSGLLYQFQILDMMGIQGIEFGTLYYRNPILNNAANLAYQKEAYEQLEGYDNYETPSGDDIFLLEKFKKDKNVKGILSSSFVVQTKIQASMKDFWNQRLRWASKSKYYQDGSLMYFSALVLLQNVVQLVVYFGLLFLEKHKEYYLILLFCKWLIDFILLFLVSSFFGRKKSLLYFIPIQILYPIYIIFIGVASKWLKFEWKERQFNG